ncbi:AMSH-like ubiquitin thioesterase 2 isoform X2 [Populus nigra]|uniref:AMSH-like ubiquitin thioesterase 2 isoform X2 n=1 Tax=Populus nigra TaxID=3691 RepID=UPI002B26C937|nr:AMSH-like ubiquitin thioesterase 2 isoform X2 [Populus nigra]
MTQTDSKCEHITVHTVTQTSPCPILSCVEKAPKYAHVSLIPVADSDQSSCNQPSASGVLQDVHIEHGTYYVTTLIIPKQESTSSSCEALKEEEFFAIQNERSLFPVGWIHTHPSQSCFMSSIDLHTHFSYQAMLPEAFAIVMAPTDQSRSYGIFRLSDPGGMSVLKECEESGFHPHGEPADGSPIYEHCANVYTNTNLRFEIFDLR